MRLHVSEAIEGALLFPVPYPPGSRRRTGRTSFRAMEAQERMWVTVPKERWRYRSGSNEWVSACSPRPMMMT